MGGNRSDRPKPLNTAVQYLRGVGPQRADLLGRLGLRTVRDVLFRFPRDYEDVSDVRPASQLEEGRPVSVCGEVEDVGWRRLDEGRRSIQAVVIRDGPVRVRAVWFNQPHWQGRFRRGQRLMLSGVPRRHATWWEMRHPKVAFLGPDESPASGRIYPIYPLTEGLSQRDMRRAAAAAVAEYAGAVEEALPESLRAARRLPGVQDALRWIHEPPDRERLAAARRRFIYQELLVLQLALAMRRAARRLRAAAPPLPATAQIRARILRRFPFELTEDQQTAIQEIAADMARREPMQRLLQGDVGSGKTVVAEYALLLAVAHRHQGVIMAPTEVLARQHARTLKRDLRGSRVRIGLLTGALAAGARRELLEHIAAGRIDVVVGTHAVLQEDVRFARLGLVVIDEQHKFGVRQRASLLRAAGDPHYLVMTATPIPRTLSLALFGDLDVSTLRRPPPGRQPVHTYWVGEDRREAWWEFFRRKLREGRQGYVITPLVDESDQSEWASVEAAFEELANGPLEAFRLDLIHGRMPPPRKEAVMNAFREGRTQALVATSVVEVGVDVPNATIMTIESGERFGLAQLHQLRGRVRRGAYPGYVGVFAQPATEDARRRLEAFCSTTDGFELAELDFQLRGPGELFSERQHGWPPLRIADLRRDQQELEAARSDARRLVDQDPRLQRPEHAPLRRRVLGLYGHVLALGDVG